MPARNLVLISALSMACAWAQSEGSIDTYQGPSVLSRGEANTMGQRAGRLVDFSYWGDVEGVYDSALSAVSVGAAGQLSNQADEGIQAGGGIVGSKTWRRDMISADYTGHFRHYVTNSFFDGTDQLLQFKWRHIVSRHVSFDVHEVGGISSLGYGNLSYVPLQNSELVGLPQNQLFDNRIYFSETGGEVYWQKSSRLSFGAGGEGFLMDYRSSALASMRGAQGRGDVVYRLSRRQKVYLTAEVTRFDYKHAFGFSTLVTTAAGYSVDIGPRWSLAMQGGAFRVHTLGLIQQQVDPAIAIIIGRDYTITTADRSVWVPEGMLHLTRRFRRSALDVGGALSVSPGNGVYLTSRSNTAFLNYSAVGTKRLTFNSTLGYSSLSSVGQQTIGKYESITGGAGATYRLHGNLHGEMRYDFYHYTTQNANYRKNENRVTAGIAFSSGERPLAIW